MLLSLACFVSLLMQQLNYLDETKYAFSVSAFLVAALAGGFVGFVERDAARGKRLIDIANRQQTFRLSVAAVIATNAIIAFITYLVYSNLPDGTRYSFCWFVMDLDLPENYRYYNFFLGLFYWTLFYLIVCHLLTTFMALLIHYEFDFNKARVKMALVILAVLGLIISLWALVGLVVMGLYVLVPGIMGFVISMGLMGVFE
jgi:hypothetical protein